MTRTFIRFKHSGNLGDVIYALPSIKKYCELHKVSAELLLIVGAPMWLPSNLSHPSGNVMLTAHGVDMLKPLLLAQTYISNVVVSSYTEGYTYPCDVDLDAFRSAGKFNMSMGSIARYYQTILGLAPDLETPWLDVNTKERQDYIVVARSSRYQNPNLDYSFMNGWKVKFLGVKSEFEEFSAVVSDAEHVEFPDFLTLANYLADSRLVIANQTFIYSLAEAIKADRILEPCLYAGNVIPVGGNNFEAFSQESFELAANKMGGRGLADVDNIEYLQLLRPWQDYLARSEVSSADAQRISLQLQSAHVPKLIFIIDATQCSQAATASSIQSLHAQQYQNFRIHVVSPAPPTAQLASVSWHQAVVFSPDLSLDLATKNPDSWLIELVGGDLLSRSGLLRWAIEALAHPDRGLYYTDEDIADPVKGPHLPTFKPDFDPDHLRSTPYIGRILLCRAREFSELGGFRENTGPARQHDYVLRYFERHTQAGIGHFSEVTFHAVSLLRDESANAFFAEVLDMHLRRSGTGARFTQGLIPGSFRVLYPNASQALVSIIIPTKNQLALLSRCIESLTEKTTYANYEILLVDNQSTDADALAYLQGITNLNLPQLRVLSYPAPFNFSAMNNLAAGEARGDYLVLLNNDTAVIQGDWLESLLNHAQRPEVGIVGAKLLYPDGKIQHGGVILGLRGPADHPFLGEAMNAPGYAGRLMLDQQYSAVTAACLMIRKSIYMDLGGMDESDFKVSYNDVNLCLKVKEAGYAVLWTPFAQLMHTGSVSQKNEDHANRQAKQERFATEQRAMYRKWMPRLIADPAYNRNLSLFGAGFELEINPLFKPTLPGQAKLLVHHGDLSGSGHYRMLEPCAALIAKGLASGGAHQHLFDPVNVAKIAPSSIVFQRQLLDHQIRHMKNCREFTTAKLIYELDDYLPNLPLSSMHKGNFQQKDTMLKLRQAMDLCDRVVVSTQPLKDALSKLHPQIVVLPNYLSLNLWGKIVSSPVRKPRRKPRVGWAGGAGHSGDLRLIADVVKALADRVDWVFFGLYPEGTESSIAQYCPGVSFLDYPAKLAHLDLDLALAPLEENTFNACKSNLRLLEYGICGYPVIASDCEPYRSGLPITLVKNRFKDWLDAIEGKLANTEALYQEGLALQAAVREHWMLEGENLTRWQEGWLLSAH